jgi:hypothetical protein
VLKVEVEVVFLATAKANCSTLARAWGVREIVDPDAALSEDFGEA